MKVLIVSEIFPYPPNKGGDRLLLFNRIKHLSQFHEIHLYTFIHQEHENEFFPYISPYCKSITTFLINPLPSLNEKLLGLFAKLPYRYSRLYNKKVATQINSLIAQQNIELVHFEFCATIQYSSSIPKHIPVIVSPNDAPTLYIKRALDLYENPLKKLQYFLHLKKLKRYQKHFFSKCHTCIVVSPDDKSELKPYLDNTNILVAPNGVDSDYFKPNSKQQRPFSLIFTGTMNYPPNVDCVLHFVKDILPKARTLYPKIHFYIVGRDPVEEIQFLQKYKYITVTDYIEDIRPLLANASIFVCPMRLGSGIKNKILEAMAMGKAIIAYPRACSGINFTSGKDILIANDPTSFVKCIKNIYSNPKLKFSLERNVRDIVVKHYSWDASVRKIHKAYCNTYEQNASTNQST